MKTSTITREQALALLRSWNSEPFHILHALTVEGVMCYQYWAEIVVGLKAKLFGPVHAGGCVRYKRRLSHSDFSAGNTWYVPGYGKYGDTRIGANFNVIIDI